MATTATTGSTRLGGIGWYRPEPVDEFLVSAGVLTIADDGQGVDQFGDDRRDDPIAFNAPGADKAR